jgi:hypothetical protein
MTRQVPTTLTASYNFSFNATSTIIPYSAYSFILALRGPSSTDYTATTSLNYITFTGTAPITGEYVYSMYALADGGVKFMIESGKITVNPDPTALATGTAVDSHESRTLAAIEAVIENRATMDQMSYQINGRSLQRTPIADLLKLRDYYKSAMQSRLKKLPRAVLIKFGNK